MSSLREIYKWYDEFNDKSLTPPPSSARFIDVVLLDEVNEIDEYNSYLKFIEHFKTIT